MILTIDIGNSNIVLGGVEGKEISFEARLRTDATKTSDEYCIDLKMILDVYGVSAANIEGVKTATPGTLNVYDILKCDMFIVAKEAVAIIEEVYA